MAMKSLKRSCSSSSSGDQTESGKDQVKYKGVRLRKWGKWVSEIRLPNSRERIWLGSYDSAEKAARAFDAAQFCLRGRNAKFNFPDSPSIDLVGGRSLTPAEIQEIASRYGNNFNHDDGEQPQGNDNAKVDDIGSQAMELDEKTTLPMTSSSDGAFRMETMDWPSSYYDNILETNTSVVAPGGTSSSNVPDYSLMLSSLDHLHEDMYMTPHFGTKFDDDNNDQDDQNGNEQYSQQSFLWNFDQDF